MLLAEYSMQYGEAVYLSTLPFKNVGSV